MIIKSYDEHGNVREPVVKPEPPVTFDLPPEGEWMCLDCQTVKDQTLMATWVPDIFSTEGLPTGSCEECAGNEDELVAEKEMTAMLKEILNAQAQIPSSKDESSFLIREAERIINY